MGKDDSFDNGLIRHIEIDIRDKNKSAFPSIFRKKSEKLGVSEKQMRRIGERISQEISHGELQFLKQ